MKWFGWGSSVVLVAGSFAGPMAACSSSTIGLNDGGALDAAGSSSGSSNDAGALDGASGSSSGSGSSGSPPPISEDASPDDLCPMLTRTGQCSTCCQGNHTHGELTYTGAINMCGCMASACQTQCASTYCSVQHTSPQATSACGMCLSAATTGSGACVGPINTACQTDSDCVALQSCLARCP